RPKGTFMRQKPIRAKVRPLLACFAAAIILAIFLPARGAATSRPSPDDLSGTTSKPSPDGADLTNMSLEDLMNVEVTSVAKEPHKISNAPAAITVISQDDM